MSKNFIAKHSAGFKGELFIPGDKSISHRSLMLGSIADGVTHVKGFLPGEDCLATLKAFQQMGVRVDIHSETELSIHGVGMRGLQPSLRTIDCGNAGTAIRLLMGLLAAQWFDSHLSGDESLQKRPMARVLMPLMQMGAKMSAKDGNFCPIHIHGGPTMKGLHHSLPVASAQVKSALLLAGLYADSQTSISVPGITRDHTERMLKTFGADINFSEVDVVLQPCHGLHAVELTIPGDLSSAAFFITAATIIPNSTLLLKQVGINPTRTGIINILKNMGADITLQNERWFGEEPVADLLIRSAQLTGIEVSESDVPLAIDELPILFIAAACAKGITTFRGAKELRVKESDRLHAMAVGLAKVGVKVTEFEDGLAIEGSRILGGTVDSFTDHRIAMAFSIAGQVSENPIEILDCDNVATSFPNFVELAKQSGMNLG